MTTTPHVIDVDVAVVGSGFSGALAAMALARRGRRVALVERGRHPRFAIGESTTPLTNLLLEELAHTYDLPEIQPFTAWGSWQRTRPDIACGLKRGFTFLFHRLGKPFADDRDHDRQLLVAASPHDEVADTHWYRPDFDRALVECAQAAGAIYLDRTELDSFVEGPVSTRLEGSRGGLADGHPRARVVIDAGFVIDASGPAGFLARTLPLASPPLRWLPATQGLYTHFAHVDRWQTAARASAEQPPYPPDDAALHHVFPGGWIWVLRFNNGLTSAGVALTEPLAALVRAHEGAPAWRRLLDLLPTVRDQFAGATSELPFIHAPRIAYRCAPVAGRSWALLPSAAGVVDPLLSTGFPLTLLGLQRLLHLLDHTDPGPERQEALQTYAAHTARELDVTERLVAALYATMNDPELFRRLSLMYFAAASFTETARRLGRADLAPGFLLCGDPAFRRALETCAELAGLGLKGAERQALFDRIDRAIEPYNVAGLGDRTRRNWYPVDADDLITGAPKLGASASEIRDLLRRSGFANA